MLAKPFFVGLVLLVVPLFYLWGGTSMSQIALLGDVYLDEGEYLGLNGQTYNHSIVISPVAGSSYVSGNIDSVRGSDYMIGYQGDGSITVNTRFKIHVDRKRQIGYSYSYQYITPKLEYDNFIFNTSSLQYLYSINIVETLNSKPVRFSGNDYIYIEALGQYTFRVGCTYLNSVCYGDSRPPSDYNLPCLRNDQTKVLDWNAQAWSGECSSQTGVNGFDWVNSGPYTYYSPDITTIGECARVTGWSYWDETDVRCPLYTRKTSGTGYVYSGVIGPYDDATPVRVAFNVPDSDGDGADDLDDLSPYNTNISTIRRAEEDLNTLSGLVAQKQDEYQSLLASVSSLNNQIREQQTVIANNELIILTQSENIAVLTSEMETRSLQLAEINSKLAMGIEALVIKQQELATLHLYSMNLTHDIRNNIHELSVVYSQLQNTSVAIESDVVALEYQLNTINWNGQTTLRTNIFSILGNMKTSISLMDSQITTMRVAIDEIENVVKEKEAIELQSQSKILELESIIAIQETLIQGQNTTISELTTLVANLKGLVAIHEKTIADNSNEIQMLQKSQADYEILVNEKTIVSEQLKNAEINLGKAEQLLDVLNQDIRAIEDKIGCSIDTIPTRIVELQEENKLLQQKIEKYDRLVTQLYDQNVSLKEKVSLLEFVNKVLFVSMIIGIVLVGYSFYSQ